jgi:hypothetical protein
MLPFSTGGMRKLLFMFTPAKAFALIKVVLNHIALLFFETVLA